MSDSSLAVPISTSSASSARAATAKRKQVINDSSCSASGCSALHLTKSEEREDDNGETKDDTGANPSPAKVQKVGKPASGVHAVSPPDDSDDDVHFGLFSGTVADSMSGQDLVYCDCTLIRDAGQWKAGQRVFGITVNLGSEDVCFQINKSDNFWYSTPIILCGGDASKLVFTKVEDNNSVAESVEESED